MCRVAHKGVIKTVDFQSLYKIVRRDYSTQRNNFNLVAFKIMLASLLIKKTSFVVKQIEWLI